MRSLPEGEVPLHEVLEWAQEQAQFLSPTQTLVLWYLCMNAWCTPDNPEGVPAGQVLSGRTAMRKIQMRTGLSERAVRNALGALQDAGFVIAEHQPGNGKSEIVVFWIEGADERREEFRAGVRDLPVGFKRKAKTHPMRITEGSESNILEFRTGTRCRNNRHEVP